MKQFVPCPYEAWQTLFDGPAGSMEMRFTDVGHLLGSASISLRITEPGRTPEIIVFSGDIGNTHQPLIRDPANPGHRRLSGHGIHLRRPQPRAKSRTTSAS